MEPDDLLMVVEVEVGFSLESIHLVTLNQPLILLPVSEVEECLEFFYSLLVVEH